MFGLSLSLGRNEKVPHSKQKWSCLGLELSHIGAGICESVCVCVCVCTNTSRGGGVFLPGIVKSVFMPLISLHGCQYLNNVGSTTTSTSTTTPHIHFPSQRV